MAGPAQPFRIALSVALVAALPLAAAHAQEDGATEAPSGIVSELRLGALYHDIPIFGSNKEDGFDVNGEVLFTSPGFLDVLGAPRPHIGASINSQGNTSQAYFGLTWDFDLPWSLFIEGSLGGSVNNGHMDIESADQKSLGCHLLFRESLSLGWRIDRHNNLSVMLDHISNANLCDRNEGLNTIGLRYGYRF